MRQFKLLLAVLSILSTTALSPAEFVAMGGIPSGGGSIKVLRGDDGTFISNPAAFLPTVALSVSWNKRAGNLLAAGGGLPSGENDIVLYQFDSTSGTLTKRIHQEFADPGAFTLKWSPDGKHLAVGGGIEGIGELKVFELCGGSLKEVASNSPDTAVLSLDWSPDGKHIVSLEADGSPKPLKVFRFTGNALQLKTAVDLISYNTGGAVSWSCANKHITVGYGDGARGHLLVFAFVGNALQAVDQVLLPPPFQINSVDWSCDGKFIATGDLSGDLHVFLFEDDDLNPVDNRVYGSQAIRSVAWYPNGRRIAIAIGEEVKTIFFDLNNQQLVPVPAWSTPHGTPVFSVDVTCCLPAFCDQEEG